MSDIFNLPELTPYTNDLEILHKTAEQLIKDFQFSGIEITFSGNPSTAYKELFSQVEPHLSKLMGTGNFFSLLYRIDLSEKQVADACKNERETSGVFCADGSYP